MALTKADTKLGIARTFPARSRRNGALYQVTLWKTGAWSCDCADWVNRRSKSRDHGEVTGDHCKHVREAILTSISAAVVIMDRVPAARAIALSADEEV